jgi:hypothetical protein
MHSRHATSAAQEALHALRMKFPPRRLTIVSTSTKPTPPPSGLATQDTPLPNAPTTARVGPATQDTPLPDAPTTAPVETDSWLIDLI